MNTFEAISRPWLWWVSSASWQLAFLVCLVAAAAAVVQKASPRLRHALWLLVLAKVFLPPALTSPVSIGRWGVSPLLRAVGASELGYGGASAPDQELGKGPPDTERISAKNDEAVACRSSRTHLTVDRTGWAHCVPGLFALRPP